MPIAIDFEYHKPKDLAEAAALLARYQGGAQLLAGGTDLIVWLKEGMKKPEALIDVKGIPELWHLDVKDDALSIGARVTFTELIESALVKNEFPVLWEAARTVASCGVRNRATLAGNLCSAVPSLDGAPALLVYDACVHTRGTVEEREIPVSEWFTGPKRTALLPDELVTAVELPLPKKATAGCYVKLGRYQGEDLAQAGLAVLAEAGNVWKLAFCAVGPVAKRAGKIEALLRGKKLSDALIAKAKTLVAQEISPITDVRASKEYRLHMCQVMLERGLKVAQARLLGKGPAYGESVL
ncbi:MAG: xanthine dehydrogenase family protein subunit M [Elusimicrobia bacterium]|jgi:carbon-monoxide dehydrogenase medium subunit|nr:xanthine dehydrogenase family protein subunit M [Elusimicrobiota bacterium]